jgi:hypothetical protein
VKNDELVIKTRKTTPLRLEEELGSVLSSEKVIGYDAGVSN